MDFRRLVLPLVLLWPVGAGAADAFEGTYRYRDGSAHGDATITRKADGGFTAAVTIGVPGCLGELAAVGREAGGVLRMKSADALSSCDVEIRKTATGIEIRELGHCDMRGGRCSFSGPYAAVAGRGPARPEATAPSAPGAGRLAGEFYCADETRLTPARMADPNFRLPLPSAGAKLSPLAYDFAFHAGALTVSDGGDATTFRPVKAAVAGDTAVYSGPKGAKWVVRPVGARAPSLSGTGISGAIRLYACSWR